MFNLVIAFVENRYPGSKSIIEQALNVLNNEHDVLTAVLTALEKYVPGSTPFLEILQGLLDEVAARQMSPDADPAS